MLLRKDKHSVDEISVKHWLKYFGQVLAIRLQDVLHNLIYHEHMYDILHFLSFIVQNVDSETVLISLDQPKSFDNILIGF